jgi:hypothetical protein
MMAIEVYNGVIVERVISGVNDKRLVIAGGHWARKMSIGDNWSELLVTIRMSTRFWLPENSGSTNNPFSFIGLCSNNTPPASLSVDHFVGFRNSHFYRGSGGDPRIYYGGNGSNNAGRIIRIENNAETVIGTTPSHMYICGDAANTGAATNGGVVAFHFKKGSPNWTVDTWGYGSNINGLYTRTLTEFLVTAAGSSSGANVASINAGAVDESTYGALDSICFVNMDAVNAFEISDIAYTRLA